MTRAVPLFLLASAALLALDAGRGREAALAAAFGTAAALGLLIAASFLWLWRRRETPLALGMSVSWAGSACFQGYLWLNPVFAYPSESREHLAVLVCLAVILTGAALHVTVIGRSCGIGREAAPVVLALAVLVAIAAVAVM